MRDAQLLPVSDLQHYHRNPRLGDVGAIAESLQANGQFKPILVNRGTLTGRPMEVLVGNHTLDAAVSLGWDTIAVEVVDVDDDRAATIVATDNRTHELGAGYDNEILSDLLDGIPDLAGTGYLPEFRDELFAELETGDLPDPMPLEMEYGSKDRDESANLRWVKVHKFKFKLPPEEFDALASAVAMWSAEHGDEAGFLADLMGGEQ